MKKTALLLAVILGLFSMTTVSAQKNSKILSGTVAYEKTKDVKASYSINPLVGYFVTNKVAVGVVGGYSKTDAANKSTSVGVFTRCHFLNIGKNCQVFSQLDATTNSTTSNNVKAKTSEVNLGFGANYTVTKKLDLTMYIADLANYEKSDLTSAFTAGIGSVTNPFATPSFGIIYKF
jgi:hypothetical protein